MYNRSTLASAFNIIDKNKHRDDGGNTNQTSYNGTRRQQKQHRRRGWGGGGRLLTSVQKSFCDTSFTEADHSTLMPKKYLTTRRKRRRKKGDREGEKKARQDEARQAKAEKNKTHGHCGTTTGRRRHSAPRTLSEKTTPLLSDPFRPFQFLPGPFRTFQAPSEP